MFQIPDTEEIDQLDTIDATAVSNLFFNKTAQNRGDNGKYSRSFFGLPSRLDKTYFACST